MKDIGAKFEVSGVEGDDLRCEAERRLEGGWPDAGWELMERCAIFGADVNSSKVYVESDADSLLGQRSKCERDC